MVAKVIRTNKQGMETGVSEGEVTACGGQGRPRGKGIPEQKWGKCGHPPPGALED